MFLKAPNANAGTGFSIDVGKNFRQGRQDAYRDQIDNFKFALEADRLNNVENQTEVERIAKNYGLNIKFDDDTRKNAINMMKDSQTMANERFNFDVTAAKLNNLYPKAADIGLSQANAFTAKTVEDEAQSAAKADMAQYKQANTGLQNDADVAKLKAELGGSRLTEAQNENKLQIAKLDKDIASWEALDADAQELEALNYAVASLKAKGQTITPAEYKKYLEDNGQYGRFLSDYSWQRYGSKVSQRQALVKAETTATGKTPNVEKFKDPKPFNETQVAEMKFPDTEDKLLSDGSKVYFYADGSVFLVNPDGSGTRYEPTMKPDGKPRTAEENAAARIPNFNTAVNTQQTSQTPETILGGK